MLHVIVILAAFWTNIFFIAVKLVDASVHRLHDDEITRNLKLGLPHEQTERIMLKIGCAPRQQKRDHLRFGCQKFIRPEAIIGGFHKPSHELNGFCMRLLQQSTIYDVRDKVFMSSNCFKFKMSLRNSASASSELTSLDDIVYDDTHTQGEPDDRVRVLYHVLICRLNNNTINMPCNDVYTVQYTDVVHSVT